MSNRYTIKNILHRNLLVFLIGLSFFYSCKNDNSKVIFNTPVEINLEQGSKKIININNKIALKKVIPLKLTDSSSISSWLHIKKIFLINNNFYLLDTKFMTISVFNTNGDHLFNIGKLGTKIGQFSNIQDMVYSSTKKSIMVLCNRPNKIIEYNTDGTFIKEHYPTFFSSNFEIESPNRYYFYTNANHTVSSQKMDLLRTDSVLRIKSRLFAPKDGQITSFASYGGLFKSTDGHIFFNRPYERDIYQMKNGNAVMRYKVEFGKEENIDSVNFTLIETYRERKSSLTNKLFFTEEYIGLNYQKKGQSRFSLYEPASNLVYSTDFQGSPVLLFTQGVFFSDNKLIIMFNPRFKKKIIDKHKSLILSQYPQLAEAISMTSNKNNSYLLIFDIKK